MTHDEAFLQAIREAPSDDAPRLIYADWLEEEGRAERAEFIRLQCRLASLPQVDESRGILEARLEVLLRRNWEEWVGPLREIAGPKYDRYSEGWLRRAYHPEGLQRFRRGFVDRLTLDAELFLANAGKLASLVPLRHLALLGAGRCARTLADCPRLANLRVLAFSDYWDAPLKHQDVPALAASSYLGGMTALFLGMNYLGDDGVEALAQAPWLASLNTIDLTENGLSERAITALTECPHLLRLTHLSLERNSLGDAGADRLARWPGLANLRTLNLTSNGITDRGARVLAESPWATRRTTLYLNDNPISPEILATLFRDKNGIPERHG
jgi:uncharacterized protein (TIGR02996 family)